MSESGTRNPDSEEITSEDIATEAPRASADNPVLTDEQIDRLRPHGTEESVSDGDVLIEEGEMEADFFVMLEGEVEVRRRGSDTALGRGGPGQFGLMEVLDERPAPVRAVISEPGRVLRIPPENLRSVVAGTSELSDLFLRTFLVRRSEMLGREEYGLRVIGSRFSEATHRIKEFASRNDVPYTWLDLETEEEAERLLCQLEVPPEETPIVIVPGGEVLRRPSNAELAEAAGIAPCSLPSEVVDLVIVGGGPAGLAASVYGASEGLSTLCVEEDALGGRAGMTSKIENYLGFPTGLSGQELARRARLQARKFGAQLAVPEHAKGLRREDGYYVVQLPEGESITRTEEVRGRAVLLATGAEYRRLPLDRLEEFEGSGVYYEARGMEAQMCSGEEVVVVGGGNSAGQAALFLTEEAEQVHMLLRSGDLTKSMSRYLVDRVRTADDIEVHLHTEAVRLHGTEHLTAVTTEDNRDGTRSTIETPALFSFIGAVPCTDWLEGPEASGESKGSARTVALDDSGFVLTGRSLPHATGGRERPAHFLETTLPGVFAAGDVRSGSIKRVASAVGEGSMAVKLVHEFLSKAA